MKYAVSGIQKSRYSDEAMSDSYSLLHLFQPQNILQHSLELSIQLLHFGMVERPLNYNVGPWPYLIQLSVAAVYYQFAVSRIRCRDVNHLIF